MRRLLPLSLMFLSLNAFAQGAVDYKNLQEVMATDFYRLTCSDIQSDIQVHTYLTVEKDQVTELKIVYVTPAKSLNVIEYSASDLKKLVVTEGQELQIAGDRPGAYWDESYLLTVRQGPQGMTGKFEYDDGDGLGINRNVNCGAVNYILSPRQ